MLRHWYRCFDCGHSSMQWTTETPQPVESPCPSCGTKYPPWASEDMTTAKFKSDNGIVDPPQLDLFKP